MPLYSEKGAFLFYTQLVFFFCLLSMILFFILVLSAV